jgi:hypothetical protein
MATRKATEDVLARTEAERAVGDELEALGLIDSALNEPTEAGRKLLDQIGMYVQFETGDSKDPDKNIVPMRRIVITGPWRVDPQAQK